MAHFLFIFIMTYYREKLRPEGQISLRRQTRTKKTSFESKNSIEKSRLAAAQA